MDRERTLQVVLGEAEPDDGFLRFVLEGEGFDIVGMASTDGELERVLRGARPDVVVVDAGISARAALEAKEQANGAALVVVWPGDVVAAIADEHVEPHLVVEDLGSAVRSASLRARPREERVVIPDTIGEVIDRWREAERAHVPAAPQEEARPDPPRLDRSARGMLVAAMTWILVLTTLATIAVGVPRALDVFAQRSPHRPTPSARPSTPSPSPETVSRPGTDIRSTGGSGCERPPCLGTGHGQHGDPTKKKKQQSHQGPETGTPGSQAQSGQANEHGGTDQGKANANENGATHIPPAPGEGTHGQDVKDEATEGGLKERRQGTGTGSGIGSSDVVVSIA
jgi:hypothetical protein